MISQHNISGSCTIFQFQQHAKTEFWWIYDQFSEYLPNCKQVLSRYSDDWADTSKVFDFKV